MQLSDIRTRVRNRLGLSSSDSDVADALLTELINDSVRYVNLLADWDWLVKQGTDTLVIDQLEYTLPNDFRSMLNVYIEQKPLARIQPAELPRYSDYKMQPRRYAVYDGKLFVDTKPVKAATITYYYLQTETELSDGTDEPAIPDWAINLVIARTAHMVAIRLRDADMVRLVEKELSDAMRLVRGEALRARRSVRPHVRSDW